MFSFAILALPLLFLSHAAADSTQEISEALRRHDYAAAAALAAKALRDHPTNPVLLTLQGLAEAGQGREQEALSFYRRAVQVRSNYLPALQAEAEIEYRRKDPDCGHILDQILRVDRNNVVAHAMRGALAYARHDCASAVAEYAQSEATIQTQPAALTQYGECLIKEGKPEQAIAVLTSAAAAVPHRWETAYNLASAQFSLGRASDSLLVLRPILEEREPPFQALDLAASAYEENGDTPHAVATLRQAIVAFPYVTELYIHFADLCFAHQSFPIGIEMLDSGLKRMPEAAPLYLARGILSAQMGQYGRAEVDFEKAAQLDPSQSSSSIALGLTQLQQSNLPEALQITENKLRQNASDAYLNYLLAEILRQRGATVNTLPFERAMRAVKRAIQLQPKFPLALDLLGDLYLRSGQLVLATEQFQKVLAIEPMNQSALYHSIIAARRSGNSQVIPSLMKRLADAKAAQKQTEDRASRYVFVHPDGSQ